MGCRVVGLRVGLLVGILTVGCGVGAVGADGGMVGFGVTYGHTVPMSGQQSLLLKQDESQ